MTAETSSGVLDRLGPQETWTLQDVLDRWAEADPDRSAMSDFNGDSLSYGELRDRVRRFAGGLAAEGVRSGDRVALLMDNSVDYLVAWFAINELRAVQVPINTASRGVSLTHVLENSGASVALADAEYVQQLAATVETLGMLNTLVVRGTRPADFGAWRTVPFAALCAAAPVTPPEVCDYRDPAAILYTSGTTGPAKGVVMSQAHMHLFAGQVTERLNLTRDDVYFVCLPLFHANAQFMQVYATLIAGGSVVIDGRFSATHWIERIRETRSTATSLLGVMAQFVYNQPPSVADSDHSLTRMMTIPLPAKVANDFERRFGVDCYEAYGMTEVCLVTLRPKAGELRPGSCGTVQDDLFEVELLDAETQLPVPVGEVGEFVVRPKWPFTTFLEYHNMPERTVESWRHLWFHTGDAGRRDEEGYFYFVDRMGDRIRRRGENVTAYDVESALHAHACVAEAAVVAVPATEGEDDIKAFVVVDGDVSFEALIEHCAEQLPYFAVPRYLELVPFLPKTETGKILKRDLRSRKRDGEWDREDAGISVTRDGIRRSASKSGPSTGSGVPAVGGPGFSE